MPPFMRHISLGVVKEELLQNEKSTLLLRCSCDVVFLLALDFTPVNFHIVRFLTLVIMFPVQAEHPNPLCLYL